MLRAHQHVGKAYSLATAAEDPPRAVVVIFHGNQEEVCVWNMLNLHHNTQSMIYHTIKVVALATLTTKFAQWPGEF